MKKQALMAFALLLLPTALLAQEGRGRGMGMGMGMQNVAKLALDNRTDLALTGEQIPKLEALARKIDEENEPYIKEMQKLRESGTSMRDMSEEQRQKMMAGREKMEKSNQVARAEIKVLFNDEQNTKLEDLIARSRPQRRGGGPGGVR